MKDDVPDKRFFLLLFAFLAILLVGWRLLPEIEKNSPSEEIERQNSVPDEKLEDRLVLIGENTLAGISPAIIPRRQVSGNISAYTPRREETDDTPLINAMGLRVQEGDIANNCLAFNTRVKIGGGIYVVRDRKNRRFGCEFFDIFMWDLQTARNFGRQQKEVIIFDN